MDNVLYIAHISLTIYGKVVNICAFSFNVYKFSNYPTEYRMSGVTLRINNSSFNRIHCLEFLPVE